MYQTVLLKPLMTQQSQANSDIDLVDTFNYLDNKRRDNEHLDNNRVISKDNVINE